MIRLLRQSRWPVIAAVAAAILLGGACASTPSAGGDGWSRSYAQPFGEVWDAAEQALELEGFTVTSADRERGRLRAEADSAALELRFAVRGEIVLVDAMGAGIMGDPVDMRGLGVQVEAVLAEMSRILRGE